MTVIYIVRIKSCLPSRTLFFWVYILIRWNPRENPEFLISFRAVKYLLGHILALPLWYAQSLAVENGTRLAGRCRISVVTCELINRTFISFLVDVKLFFPDSYYD